MAAVGTKGQTCCVLKMMEARRRIATGLQFCIVSVIVYGTEKWILGELAWGGVVHIFRLGGPPFNWYFWRAAINDFETLP
jgi:hypothetical protein